MGKASQAGNTGMANTIPQKETLSSKQTESTDNLEHILEIIIATYANDDSHLHLMTRLNVHCLPLQLAIGY